MTLLPSLVLLLSLPFLAHTADIHITVSSSSGHPAFHPSSTTAAPGDILVFSFPHPAAHHAVAQSAPDAPCRPSPHGFFSGVPPPGQVFRVPVTAADPVVFYSTAPGACAAGMVGVVNPADGLDVATLRRRAKEEGEVSNLPDAVGGGKFAPAGLYGDGGAVDWMRGFTHELDIRLVGGGVAAAAIVFAIRMM